jgi:hypothetical protein
MVDKINNSVRGRLAVVGIASLRAFLGILWAVR